MAEMNLTKHDWDVLHERLNRAFAYYVLQHHNGDLYLPEPDRDDFGYVISYGEANGTNTIHVTSGCIKRAEAYEPEVSA